MMAVIIVTAVIVLVLEGGRISLLVKECCNMKKRIERQNWGSRWIRSSAVERWARLRGGGLRQV